MSRVGVLIVTGMVHAYRVALRPLLPPACRFEPTCSEYCLQAVARHGALRGLGLTARRIARCHPWNPGGLDPIPDANPARGRSAG